MSLTILHTMKARYIKHYRSVLLLNMRSVLYKVEAQPIKNKNTDGIKYILFMCNRPCNVPPFLHARRGRQSPCSFMRELFGVVWFPLQSASSVPHLHRSVFQSPASIRSHDPPESLTSWGSFHSWGDTVKVKKIILYSLSCCSMMYFFCGA